MQITSTENSGHYVWGGIYTIKPNNSFIFLPALPLLRWAL